MKKWVKATAVVLALMGLSMKNAYAIDTTTVNENVENQPWSMVVDSVRRKFSKLLNY